MKKNKPNLFTFRYIYIQKKKFLKILQNNYIYEKNKMVKRIN